ncbi:hypothetical protein ACHQM5_025508 [Ranunculus cassubicifolius]
MAKLTTMSSSTILSSLIPNPILSSNALLPCNCYFSAKKISKNFKINANLGGSGDGNSKGGDKKKFITREQEPEQYWQTAGEREGENPMMTPLPYIFIFSMSTPFIILAIAFANGWIKGARF